MATDWRHSGRGDQRCCSPVWRIISHRSAANGRGVQIYSEVNDSAIWGSLWLVAWVFDSDVWVDDSELNDRRLIFELENLLRNENIYQFLT